jgi:hypothetical protein
VQTALLAWLVGRGLEHPLLRWCVFLWSLLLIDVQLVTVIASDQSYLSPATVLAYAMLSAQAALAAVWGALGEMRWTWRLPAALVAASLLGFFLMVVNESVWTPWRNYSHDVWPLVLVLQSTAALGVCLALAAVGYRMAKPDEDVNPYDDLRAPGERRRPLQFSLKHLMIWMTALGPAVLVLRGLGLWMTARFGLGLWIEMLTLAVVLAAVSLLAIWSATGPEGASLRIPLLLVLAPTVGAVLGLLAIFGWWQELKFLPWVSGFERVMYWMIWTTLAGYFLGGLMLIFRAEGCRLERSQARRPATSERASMRPA